MRLGKEVRRWWEVYRRMGDLRRRMSEWWEWALGDEEGVNFESRESIEEQRRGRR